MAGKINVDVDELGMTLAGDGLDYTSGGGLSISSKNQVIYEICNITTEDSNISTTASYAVVGLIPTQNPGYYFIVSCNAFLTFVDGFSFESSYTFTFYIDIESKGYDLKKLKPLISKAAGTYVIDTASREFYVYVRQTTRLLAQAGIDGLLDGTITISYV